MPKRILEGVVVSEKNDKTIVVKVERRLRHPVLKKTVRVSKKYHAHDETNQAKLGEVVKIQEMRPLSKLKRWSLVERVGMTKLEVTPAKAKAPKPAAAPVAKAKEAKPAAAKKVEAANPELRTVSETKVPLTTTVTGSATASDRRVATVHGTDRVETTHRTATAVKGGHRVEEIEGDPNEGKDHILKTVRADDVKE